MARKPRRKPTTRTPEAIPTVYREITFRSRLEAQCAYLLDQLGWEWEYEPASYMLPNGISFIPDFLVRDFFLFIECRGYSTGKGKRQIDGLRSMIADGAGPVVEPEYGDRAIRFLVLYGDRQPEYFEESRYCTTCLLVHCRECGWHLGSVSETAIGGMGHVQVYCPSCIAPYPPTPKGWDGRSQIDRVAVVTAFEGKLLVNGEGVEYFHNNGGGAA